MQFLLKLARDAIENFVKNNRIIPIPENYPEEFKEKKGVFVTLYKKHSFGKELMGCIGFPYPQKPLIEALIESAISACNDTRFPPLSQEELKDILIEVSILTEPEKIEIKNQEDFKKIIIGKHGLIIRKGNFSGLFLPKVPVEQNWNIKEYLENLCYKAGLSSNDWIDSEIYRFEAEVL